MVLEPEDVPELVLDHGEQVHALQPRARRLGAELARARLDRELAVARGSRVDEPPVPGRVVVDQDDVPDRLREHEALEVDHLEGDPAQGSLHTGRADQRAAASATIGASWSSPTNALEAEDAVDAVAATRLSGDCSRKRESLVRTVT